MARMPAVTNPSVRGRASRQATHDAERRDRPVDCRLVLGPAAPFFARNASMNWAVPALSGPDEWVRSRLCRLPCCPVELKKKPSLGSIAAASERRVMTFAMCSKGSVTPQCRRSDWYCCRSTLIPYIPSYT